MNSGKYGKMILDFTLRKIVFSYDNITVSKLKCF